MGFILLVHEQGSQIACSTPLFGKNLYCSKMWGLHRTVPSIPKTPSQLLSYLPFRSTSSRTRPKHQQPPEPDKPVWDEHIEGWDEEVASDSEAIVKAERHATAVKQKERKNDDSNDKDDSIVVIEKDIKSLQTYTTQHFHQKTKEPASQP